MAHLSWNEIQDRATEFATKYDGETYEKGESQSFWSDFLSVFGVDRKRHGAFFEYAIKKAGGGQGFIDMFWPGKLLAEQKSGGRDLSKANTQAFEYLHNMPDHDLPQAIVVSDFATFQFIDLETDAKTEFTLEQLPKYVHLFGFLVGESSRKLAEENPVNRKAAEAMAQLHNTLRDTGYTGHDLELLLVRLVFCLFADDSGIFEHRSFEHYMYNRTEVDGSDFGPKLVKLFQVLNTDVSGRSPNLDQDLAAFPYINGGLFADNISIPDFNHAMRDALLKAMELDWSQVSPAIFGSMFQGVMDEKQRRNLGAHYTSEKNILKVIKPLFLDELYEEFARIKHRKTELAKFHDKLRSLTFLDPACGCGNFLVITYRELRRLEHKVLDALYGKNIGMFDVGEHGVVKCDVDQMYGIEIEEFPSLIAETALWLTDHQMNREYTKQTGITFRRIPLKKRANIENKDALKTTWEEIFPDKSPHTGMPFNYILGNPPFIGSKMMTQEQREMATKYIVPRDGSGKVLPRDNLGVLDFVAGWYMQAVLYIMQFNFPIRVAFVSTNSITQGEQVAILWRNLLSHGIKIDFAHRTFKWNNDAKGNAAVYCVIVGFSYEDYPRQKRIFDYPDIKGDPVETVATNISPYLIDAPNVFVQSRNTPICDVPRIGIGNKPIDNGNYLFLDDEKEELLRKEPGSEKLFHRWVGADEFINNKVRWCLYFDDTPPSEINKLPHVKERISNVRQFRLGSISEATRVLADFPTRYHVKNVPKSEYIVIPSVSSERRQYIPIGYLPPEVLASNLVLVMADATLYHFGVLTSQMHMAWMRAVAGRLKSDYRYSKDIVYNNFIWPEATEAQKAEIEKLAQAVLDARAEFPDASLADLYDPLTMPPVLMKAHKQLDRAVDHLYRKQPFTNDPERVALLFEEYKKAAK